MRDVLEESLKKSKRVRMRKTGMISILLVLSLFVSLDVFWSLRQPGWTLAGDADCKSAHNGNLITFHRVKNFRDLIY